MLQETKVTGDIMLYTFQRDIIILISGKICQVLLSIYQTW